MTESGALRCRLYLVSYLSLDYIYFFVSLKLLLQGPAEVLFAMHADANAAVKKYNNVQLDDKPMKNEIVGTNTQRTAAALSVTNGRLDRNAARRYTSDLHY